MGVIGSSWNTAIGVGPLVGLWLFARSPEMLWILCGVAGIAAAGLMLIRANVHEDKPAQDVTALKKAPISP